MGSEFKAGSDDVYMYMCTRMCMCACVVVCVTQRREGELNRIAS